MIRWSAVISALVPVVALAIAVPFVNRDQPTVFGLPFVMFWVIAWVLLTPPFMWLVGRLERRW